MLQDYFAKLRHLRHLIFNGTGVSPGSLRRHLGMTGSHLGTRCGCRYEDIAWPGLAATNAVGWSFAFPFRALAWLDLSQSMHFFLFTQYSDVSLSLSHSLDLIMF